MTKALASRWAWRTCRVPGGESDDIAGEMGHSRARPHRRASTSPRHPTQGRAQVILGPAGDGHVAAGLAAVAPAGPAGAAATRATGHHHAAASSGPAGDETTGSQNDLRDGWDPNEPALTQAAVGGGQFGQIFKTQVNGQVYAQPLVIGNTVIVATENDWVYGLNATTGAVGWKTSLGKAYHITSCVDLDPEHRCHLDAGLRPQHRLGVRHGDGQGDQRLAVPPVRARRRHGRDHAAAADRRLAPPTTATSPSIPSPRTSEPACCC